MVPVPLEKFSKRWPHTTLSAVLTSVAALFRVPEELTQQFLHLEISPLASPFPQTAAYPIASPTRNSKIARSRGPASGCLPAWPAVALRSFRTVVPKKARFRASGGGQVTWRVVFAAACHAA